MTSERTLTVTAHDGWRSVTDADLEARRTPTTWRCPSCGAACEVMVEARFVLCRRLSEHSRVIEMQRVAS